MAHSFDRSCKSQTSRLPGQPFEIKRPKTNLHSVYRLIAHRRIRYTKVFAVLIAFSVFLSVTVSFVITTIIARNVEVLTAKVRPTRLPFHGIVTFEDQESLDDFVKKIRFPGTVEQIEYLEVESNIGNLCLLGTGNHLPDDTIEFLFSFRPRQNQSGYDVVAWAKDNPSSKIQWANIIVPKSHEENFPGLYGWALVNPSVISKSAYARPGILLTVDEHYRFDPLSKSDDRLVSKFFHNIETGAPEGARVITPYSGRLSLKIATQGAFSSWQVISLIVLLAAAAAITCILTVSFLGRKRSLGILRVLGVTVTDLRRMMSLETAYIGTPGIILGVFAGKSLAQLLDSSAVLPGSAFIVAIITGTLTLIAGVWMPLRLIKNANCDQLLNNRPVYVFTNPSCANCGLCGGI